MADLHATSQSVAGRYPLTPTADYCPAWPNAGHNWLQGGPQWRDWRHLRPWRRVRVCVACKFEESV